MNVTLGLSSVITDDTVAKGNREQCVLEDLNFFFRLFISSATSLQLIHSIETNIGFFARSLAHVLPLPEENEINRCLAALGRVFSFFFFFSFIDVH